MGLKRRLIKVSYYHLALFILPAIFVLYYGWWKAPELNQRPDNPMHASSIGLRGAILDRKALALAVSQGGSRFYPLKEAAGPLVGYSLSGRSEGGLEAALREQLSPQLAPKSLWSSLAQDLKGQGSTFARIGPSLELTIDAGLQRDLYQIFTPPAGAFVVARARSGEVLAAISKPSFDPNHIANDWQHLRADPLSPLIERVGAGLYPACAMDNKELITQKDAVHHLWFSDNPFPLYPGASPAVAIEGKLLFTPLMLLQIAGNLTKQDQPMVPKLLKADLASGDERTWSESSTIPSLKSLLALEGWRIARLQGPQFRESPSLSIVIGKGQGREALAFAMVIENSSDSHSELLRKIVERLKKV